MSRYALRRILFRRSLPVGRIATGHSVLPDVSSRPCRPQLPSRPLQTRRMVVVTKSSASDPAPQLNDAVDVMPVEGPSNVDAENLSVEITPGCVKQIHRLLKKKGKSPEEMFLRVFVDAGGCSGFTYQFELDEELIEEEDFVFEPPNGDGVRVVVDEASLKLIHGSKIDYVQEMIKSSFVIADNPQSESACGCGSSFAVKNFSANPALD